MVEKVVIQGKWVEDILTSVALNCPNDINAQLTTITRALALGAKRMRVPKDTLVTILRTVYDAEVMKADETTVGKSRPHLPN